MKISLKKIVVALLLIYNVAAQEGINCRGKAFRCMNSTHFLICVDLGNGVSTTVDLHAIECPPYTTCHNENTFECELETTAAVTVTEDLLNVIPNERSESGISTSNSILQLYEGPNDEKYTVKLKTKNINKEGEDFVQNELNASNVNGPKSNSINNISTSSDSSSFKSKTQLNATTNQTIPKSGVSVDLSNINNDNKSDIQLPVRTTEKENLPDTQIKSSLQSTPQSVTYTDLIVTAAQGEKLSSMPKTEAVVNNLVTKNNITESTNGNGNYDLANLSLNNNYGDVSYNGTAVMTTLSYVRDNEFKVITTPENKYTHLTDVLFVTTVPPIKISLNSPTTTTNEDNNNIFPVTVSKFAQSPEEAATLADNNNFKITTPNYFNSTELESSTTGSENFSSASLSIPPSSLFDNDTEDNLSIKDAVINEFSTTNYDLTSINRSELFIIFPVPSEMTSSTRKTEERQNSTIVSSLGSLLENSTLFSTDKPSAADIITDYSLTSTRQPLMTTIKPIMTSNMQQQNVDLYKKSTIASVPSLTSNTSNITENNTINTTPINYPAHSARVTSIPAQPPNKSFMNQTSVEGRNDTKNIVLIKTSSLNSTHNESVAVLIEIGKIITNNSINYISLTEQADYTSKNTTKTPEKLSVISSTATKNVNISVYKNYNTTTATPINYFFPATDVSHNRNVGLGTTIIDMESMADMSTFRNFNATTQPQWTLTTEAYEIITPLTPESSITSNVTKIADKEKPVTSFSNSTQRRTTNMQTNLTEISTTKSDTVMMIPILTENLEPNSEKPSSPLEMLDSTTVSTINLIKNNNNSFTTETHYFYYESDSNKNIVVEESLTIIESNLTKTASSTCFSNSTNHNMTCGDIAHKTNSNATENFVPASSGTSKPNETTKSTLQNEEIEKKSTNNNTSNTTERNIAKLAAKEGDTPAEFLQDETFSRSTITTDMWVMPSMETTHLNGSSSSTIALSSVNSQPTPPSVSIFRSPTTLRYAENETNELSTMNPLSSSNDLYLMTNTVTDSVLNSEDRSSTTPGYEPTLKSFSVTSAAFNIYQVSDIISVSNQKTSTKTGLNVEKEDQTTILKKNLNDFQSISNAINQYINLTLADKMEQPYSVTAGVADSIVFTSSEPFQGYQSSNSVVSELVQAENKTSGNKENGSIYPTDDIYRESNFATANENVTTKTNVLLMSQNIPTLLEIGQVNRSATNNFYTSTIFESVVPSIQLETTSFSSSPHSSVITDSFLEEMSNLEISNSKLADMAIENTTNAKPRINETLDEINQTPNIKGLTMKQITIPSSTRSGDITRYVNITNANHISNNTSSQKQHNRNNEQALTPSMLATYPAVEVDLLKVNHSENTVFEVTTVSYKPQQIEAPFVVGSSPPFAFGDIKKNESTKPNEVVISTDDFKLTSKGNFTMTKNNLPSTVKKIISGSNQHTEQTKPIINIYLYTQSVTKSDNRFKPKSSSFNFLLTTPSPPSTILTNPFFNKTNFSLENMKTEIRSAPGLNNFTCNGKHTGRYPDLYDVKKYFLCIGMTRPVVAFCPSDSIYVASRNQCCRSSKICDEYNCLTEGRFTDPCSNNSYFICQRNKTGIIVRYKLICQPGYYVSNSIKCAPVVDGSTLDVASRTTAAPINDFKKQESESSFLGGEIKLLNNNNTHSKNICVEFNCYKPGRYKDACLKNTFYICQTNESNKLVRYKVKCTEGYQLNSTTIKCEPTLNVLLPTPSAITLPQTNDIFKSIFYLKNDSFLINISDENYKHKINVNNRLKHYDTQYDNENKNIIPIKNKCKENKFPKTDHNNKEDKVKSKESSEEIREVNKNKARRKQRGIKENHSEEKIKFKCIAKGKYPHSSDNRKYYDCTLNENDRFRMRHKRCRRGEVFDRRITKCREWS